MNICAVVVSGGGSGIGTMFAAAYVQNGAKVYIASRKEKQLQEVRLTQFHIEICLGAYSITVRLQTN